MNIRSALIILNLNNKYNIHNILELNQNELKKSYHIMALEYHPDKNNSSNATYNFQKIQNAYNFLNNIINNSSKTLNEENNNNFTYENLILNFIDLLVKNYTTEDENYKNYKNYENINKFKNDCINYSYKLIENLLDKLNIDTLQEIYNFLNKKILNYDNISNNNSIELIKNILIKKLKNYNIIIINPVLKNILNNEIYKLSIDNINLKNEENEDNKEFIYIPLWHNEFNYFNNVIKIKPILNKDIIIDENNNIIKYYYNTFDHFINLIKTYDFPYIKIFIEDIELIVPINEVKMKKNQNYIFKKIGISKINYNDIFDTSKIANIIININLS